jgi:hypothetical protein
MLLTVPSDRYEGSEASARPNTPSHLTEADEAAPLMAMVTTCGVASLRRSASPKVATEAISIRGRDPSGAVQGTKALSSAG